MRSGPSLTRPQRWRCLLGARWLLLLQGTVALNLLQWNPHWECFEWNKHNCKEEFVKRLSDELVQGDIDFANIVEFSSDHGALPPGWKSLEHQCGIDRTTLIYNSDRWRVPAASASGRKGCMATKDRPFVVQQFTEAPAWGGARKVIIVGAHYPHTRDRTTLIGALRAVKAFSGVGSVVLMADTNENNGVSNERVFGEIEASGVRLHGSDLMATCCLNSGFRKEMAYDRIIANFGSAMSSSMLLETVPGWAQGEFHKPVKARLVDSGTGKTSTTTTITTSSTTTVTTTTTTTTTTTNTGTITTTTTTTTTTPAPVAPVIFSVLGNLVCSVGCLALCGAAFGHKLFVGNATAARDGKRESTQRMLPDQEAPARVGQPPQSPSSPGRSTKPGASSPRSPAEVRTLYHAGQPPGSPPAQYEPLDSLWVPPPPPD